MILVTGAAGKTGRAVITALLAKGEKVRAFVRRDPQIEMMRALGAQAVRVGDLMDGSALGRAAEGARAIYHICPNVSPEEVPIGRNVIDAARQAGIGRFVYHSVLHPQTEAMPHHWQKLRVEEMLFDAALDVTVLQPAAYMQNILAGWQRVVEHGVYAFPYPVSTRLSLVDLDDVASVAALVLTAPGHGGATYELVGTPPLDQREVAAALGRALGRPVRAEPQSVDDFAMRARAAGMGDYQRESLMKMFSCYARSGLVGNPNVLRWLVGREPTTFDQFLVREAMSRTGR
jgi:uncharacterized protein YbjT (DUF2867 family)